jgi:hypothetical protein
MIPAGPGKGCSTDRRVISAREHLWVLVSMAKQGKNTISATTTSIANQLKVCRRPFLAVNQIQTKPQENHQRTIRKGYIHADQVPE